MSANEEYIDYLWDLNGNISIASPTTLDCPAD